MSNESHKIIRFNTLQNALIQKVHKKVLLAPLLVFRYYYEENLLKVQMNLEAELKI